MRRRQEAILNNPPDVFVVAREASIARDLPFLPSYLAFNDISELRHFLETLRFIPIMEWGSMNLIKLDDEDYGDEIQLINGTRTSGLENRDGPRRQDEPNTPRLKKPDVLTSK